MTKRMARIRSMTRALKARRKCSREMVRLEETAEQDTQASPKRPTAARFQLRAQSIFSLQASPNWEGCGSLAPALDDGQVVEYEDTLLPFSPHISSHAVSTVVWCAGVVLGRSCPCTLECCVLLGCLNIACSTSTSQNVGSSHTWQGRVWKLEARQRPANHGPGSTTSPSNIEASRTATEQIAPHTHPVSSIPIVATQ